MVEVKIEFSCPNCGFNYLKFGFFGELRCSNCKKSFTIELKELTNN